MYMSTRLTVSQSTKIIFRNSFRCITTLNDNSIPLDKNNSLDFTKNFESAFKGKPTKEIVRALAMLKVCSYKNVVDKSEQLMGVYQKTLGKIFGDWPLRKTIYDQFVGGDDPETLHEQVEKLKGSGIRCMLAVAMEEDRGSGDRDAVYDLNEKIMSNCVKLEKDLTESHPKMQLKITALMPGELVTEMTTSMKGNENVFPVEKLAETFLTGSKVTLNSLDEKQNDQLYKGLLRLQKICAEAKKHNVKVLVDAEYTYMNPALALITRAMMLIYNKDVPLIWNTYQCYLKDARKNILSDMEFADTHNVTFGVKLVRGAYLVKERLLAKQNGYPDPVNDTYELTSQMYNNVLGHLLDECASRKDRLNFIIASHNEDSIKFALKRMNDLSISKTSNQVFFAQLYGMCEQISYPLAKNGYAVYKSIPYGSLEATLHYLVRRAQENRSVMLGVRRERDVLWHVLKNRVLPFRASS